LREERFEVGPSEPLVVSCLSLVMARLDVQKGDGESRYFEVEVQKGDVESRHFEVEVQKDDAQSRYFEFGVQKRRPL